MKRSVFVITNFFIIAILVLLSWANSSYDYSIGRKNFRHVTELIAQRYEKERDVAALYEKAWDSLVEILPATGELIAAGSSVPSESKAIQGFYVDRIESVITLTARKQTDDATPTVRDLWNQAMNGMVGALDDPYSQYLPPKLNEELQRVLSGKPDESRQFYGVGISVEWDTLGDEGVLVISPLPDTPAERSGIRSGDIIIGVEGDMFKTWQGTVSDKLQKAIDKIKGEKDTEVKLTIKKTNSPEPLEVRLKRAPINPDVQIFKEKLDDEIGRIRLYSFYENAANDVLDAMRYLKMEGMKKLIFDLRSDPGGYLDQAVHVADIFLEKGKLITYTEGRKSPRTDFIDEVTGADGFAEIPMIILMNEWSASASEVVTGALKDNGRAVVIGKKSFGKGSVQEVFGLAGGAGLRLTVAKYYTPSGVCIHEKGIEPHMEVSSVTEEEYNDKYKEKDYNHVPRLERLFDLDPQLKAAVQYFRGELSL
ncbi:MAG: S41 family peptidase [Candidatus Omnitrophota bacterium]|jgi:carboxyl-terminal processing protease|nr:MAG: S41 family peptidase [Candidatus Omnitrophota bacterium]